MQFKRVGKGVLHRFCRCGTALAVVLSRPAQAFLVLREGIARRLMPFVSTLGLTEPTFLTEIAKLGCAGRIRMIVVIQCFLSAIRVFLFVPQSCSAETLRKASLQRAQRDRFENIAKTPLVAFATGGAVDSQGI